MYRTQITFEQSHQGLDETFRDLNAALNFVSAVIGVVKIEEVRISYIGPKRDTISHREFPSHLIVTTHKHSNDGEQN